MEEIREIPDGAGLEESVRIIREPFAAVARRFSLTPENAPTHPSFMTTDRLEELRAKGARFFGLFEGERQTGFIAVEKADGGKYYLERLAVLPGRQSRGHGRKLMEYAIDRVREAGGRNISIAVMDPDEGLREWYVRLGFRDKEVKDYPHLPFRVRFMELEL